MPSSPALEASLNSPPNRSHPFKQRELWDGFDILRYETDGHVEGRLESQIHRLIAPRVLCHHYPQFEWSALSLSRSISPAHRGIAWEFFHTAGPD